MLRGSSYIQIKTLSIKLTDYMTKTLLATTLCIEFEGQYFNPCGLEIYNGGRSFNMEVHMLINQRWKCLVYLHS